jgi:hypothetical protein
MVFDKHGIIYSLPRTKSKDENDSYEDNTISGTQHKGTGNFGMKRAS